MLSPIRLLFISPIRTIHTKIFSLVVKGLQSQGMLIFNFLYENECSYKSQIENVEWADVVVFFYSYNPKTLQLLRLANEKNKGTLYLLDNDLSEVKANSSINYNGVDVESFKIFKSMIIESDLVWVITEEMAEFVGELNPNVVLKQFPNPVHLFLQGQNDAMFHPIHSNLTIGYEGGNQKEQNINLIIQPIVRLLKIYKSFLRIELNFIPDELKNYSQIAYIPFFRDYKEYYLYLTRARWSIGLDLIENKPFNKEKINHKYLEYATLGIPGIYSDISDNSKYINHCINGYLTKNTEEGIFESIQTMIENPKLRQDIRRMALHDISCKYSVKAFQMKVLQEVSLLLIKKNNKRSGYNKKTTFLIVGYENVSTTYIAGLQPFNRLKNEGLLEFEYKTPNEVNEESVKKVECVYIVRVCEPSYLRIFDWAQKNNIPIIFCWDDDFFSISNNQLIWKHYQNNLLRLSLEKILRESNLVMASTLPLIERSKAYNQNVIETVYGFSAPDCSKISELEYCRTTKNHRIRIGFFGVNPVLNLPFMLETLKRLRYRYGQSISFELIGSKASSDLASLLDWQWNKLLTVDASLCLLRSRSWDIGLAPLEDTEFNSSKQATKFRDYAWCESAIVFSNVPSYNRIIQNNINGILVENTADAWEKAISTLIDDPEMRRFIATGAKRLLEEEHTLDILIAPWYQILLRVLNSRIGKL